MSTLATLSRTFSGADLECLIWCLCPCCIRRGCCRSHLRQQCWIANTAACRTSRLRPLFSLVVHCNLGACPLFELLTSTLSAPLLIIHSTYSLKLIRPSWLESSNFIHLSNWRRVNFNPIISVCIRSNSFRSRSPELSLSNFRKAWAAYAMATFWNEFSCKLCCSWTTFHQLMNSP